MNAQTHEHCSTQSVEASSRGIIMNSEIRRREGCVRLQLQQVPFFLLLRSAFHPGLSHSDSTPWRWR